MTNHSAAVGQLPDTNSESPFSNPVTIDISHAGYPGSDDNKANARKAWGDNMQRF